jgi:hypothetical protein
MVGAVVAGGITLLAVGAGGQEGGTLYLESGTAIASVSAPLAISGEVAVRVISLMDAIVSQKEISSDEAGFADLTNVFDLTRVVLAMSLQRLLGLVMSVAIRAGISRPGCIPRRR